MGAFEYTAMDTAGREKRGVLEGDTPRQVRQQLREQGLTPLNVEAVSEREAKRERRGGWQRGISSTDLALFTRQLATLVRAGLPLEEALQAVAQQTDKGRIKSMIMGVRARVLEGHSLAAGLGDFPHVFSELYRATVEAGEQSGHLDVVLERLADYTDARQQMSQRLMLALIYPALLSTVAILVVIGLLAYVVPEVVQVFASLGQDLPWLTRALIAVSDFVRGYGLLMLLAVIAAVVTAVYMLRVERVRFRFHQFLLRLPLVRRLIRSVNAARFARTLSILMASAVPVLDALRIAASVMTNLPMRRAVEEAALRVREGSSLHAALQRSGQFPPMTLHLIGSGESSGKLEAMLERAAINQEREVETLLGALMGLLEPLMILVMGGMVLVIVLAILLPIFDLNQLVR